MTGLIAQIEAAIAEPPPYKHYPYYPVSREVLEALVAAAKNAEKLGEIVAAGIREGWITAEVSRGPTDRGGQ